MSNSAQCIVTVDDVFLCTYRPACGLHAFNFIHSKIYAQKTEEYQNNTSTLHARGDRDYRMNRTQAWRHYRQSPYSFILHCINWEMVFSFVARRYNIVHF